MTSIRITNSSIRAAYAHNNLRSDAQIIEYLIMSKITTNDGMEDIQYELRLMEMWYILIITGRVNTVCDLLVRSYGNNVTMPMMLYDPWAYSIRYWLKNSEFKIYVEGSLILFDTLTIDEVYELCEHIISGLYDYNIVVSGFNTVEQYVDKEYLLYYYLYTRINTFVAMWFYVSCLITPNTHISRLLATTCPGDKKSAIAMQVKIEKHLRNKSIHHWALVQKSQQMENYDKKLRVAYKFVDENFQFNIMFNYIRDIRSNELIHILAQALRTDDVWDQNNIIPHILQFIVYDVSIVTTLATIMNENSLIYKALQDKAIDFNEKVSIRFGMCGCNIEGYCHVIGRTFTYVMHMKNSLLHGDCMYSNTMTRLVTKAHYKYGNIVTLNVTDNIKPQKIVASYLEDSIHGYTQIDNFKVTYKYGKMIL